MIRVILDALDVLPGESLQVVLKLHALQLWAEDNPALKELEQLLDTATRNHLKEIDEAEDEAEAEAKNEDEDTK